METGVVFCTLCSSREAQYTCICQFPLPRLCASAECTEIHTGKKSAYFHYFLPTSASDFVTARNHLSIQQRVLALHHTQSRLISSLSLLDTAVLQIEEAYQRQVAALAELKDQYIARINQLKEAATEAFNYAIGETAQHAANVDYNPQSEIAQWVWTMASKAEIDDIPLFQSEIRETRTEEVGEMLALKVISMFQSLTPWSIEFSTDWQVHTESWALVKQSNFRCKVCHFALKPEDAAYQCPNACLCIVCSIDHVIARGRQCCMHCNKPFSPKVISAMFRGAKKCHVCGIALPLNDFAMNASCDVCLRCIELCEYTAKCMKCRDYNFFVSLKEVLKLRENIKLVCCNYNMGDPHHYSLRCNHLVCQIHKETLLVCRRCRSENLIQ